VFVHFGAAGAAARATRRGRSAVGWSGRLPFRRNVR
jgi:hypothetical protein